MFDLPVLPVWEFLIVALAAARITQFFVYDKLFGASIDSESKFSERLDAWAYKPPHGEDRSFIRGKIGDLLTCPYCLGFWISIATYLFWVKVPDWRWAVVVWAVAFVQVFVNVALRFVGNA